MLPKPISIPSVNKNTAKAIIATLLSSNGITRTELARACGVSAMTAGKVVSAMCSAGYASIGTEISECGRRSDFIYPSERFTFLIFYIGERTMSAEIYDARDNTRFCYTQPRCDGVDAHTDAAAFIAFVNEQLEDSDEREYYRLSALISYGTGVNAQSLGAYDVSVSAKSLDAAAEYVKRAYPTECVAFVGADSTCDIRLIAKGEEICGKTATRRRSAKSITSELDMLSVLSERLASIFELLIPDRVVIDSRSLHLSRRFSSELGELLTERTGLQKEELPELVTNDGIPFPSRAVIGQLIDIYAEIISAI